MRIAQCLTSRDLEPLRAWLLDRPDDSNFLQKTKEDYSEFRHAEFAFIIMHDWMERTGEPSLQQLYQLMVNADIDRHVICKVWITRVS